MWLSKKQCGVCFYRPLFFILLAASILLKSLGPFGQGPLESFVFIIKVDRDCVYNPCIFITTLVLPLWTSGLMPTFIRKSPEYVFPFPREDAVPGYRPISVTWYFLSRLCPAVAEGYSGIFHGNNISSLIFFLSCYPLPEFIYIKRVHGTSERHHRFPCGTIKLPVREQSWRRQGCSRVRDRLESF